LFLKAPNVMSVSRIFRSASRLLTGNHMLFKDLRSWADPSAVQERSQIEYFDTIEDALKRFNDLRNMPYNAEKALNSQTGEPMARLELISLHYFDGLSVTEIAKLRNEDFHKTRYEREKILKKLRIIMGEIN